MTHPLTIPRGGGGGGGGPESSPATSDPSTWSIQQGLSRIDIQNFDITNLSYRGRYVKLHLCFQLLPARKSLCYWLAKY